MNINDAFPSNYLKAGDLKDAEAIVTIVKVEVEEVGRDKEQKLVLYFKGKKKGLVLNKTNSKKIATVLSADDTDEWVGKQIKLYPTETEFGGETVDCIRVKAATTSNGHRPAAVKPPPRPPVEEEHPLSDNDDDIPF